MLAPYFSSAPEGVYGGGFLATYQKVVYFFRAGGSTARRANRSWHRYGQDQRSVRRLRPECDSCAEEHGDRCCPEEPDEPVGDLLRRERTYWRLCLGC